MQKQNPAAFRQQTQGNYDRISAIYDLLSGGAEKRLINTVVEGMELDHPLSIIEIGCGTGNGLIALTKKYPAACLIGLDLSFGMCRQASRKYRHASHSADSLICQGDALNLPFINKSADLIFISFTFELFPQTLQSDLFQEIKRLLAAQGRITVISMYKEKDPGWMSRIYAAARRRFPNIIDCRPLDGPAIFKQHGFSILNQSLHNIWGIPVISFTAGILT